MSCPADVEIRDVLRTATPWSDPGDNPQSAENYPNFIIKTRIALLESST